MGITLLAENITFKRCGRVVCGPDVRHKERPPADEVGYVHRHCEFNRAHLGITHHSTCTPARRHLLRYVTPTT